MLPGAPVPVDGDEVVAITDPDAYVRAALDRELGDLATAPDGTRNDALNRASFAIGRLIGGGLPVDPDEVEAKLYAAAEENGYAAEHHDTLRTIARGLEDGAHRAPLAWQKVDPPEYDRPAPFVVPAHLEKALEDVARSSWWPRELAGVLAGLEEEPPPSVLERTDGKHLFYAGKVNALIGESESGKTWVALVAVLAELREGHVVLILDFEDTARGVVGRLRALGAGDDELRRLVYVSPDEPLHDQAARDLEAVTTSFRPTLIVVDGVNAAMTLLGLDLNSNTDATRFSLEVLRPLKRTGAAVVTIDHVTKSKDGRGSYAIGAQAKRADIDGASLIVEVVDPFGRGMTGRLRLLVSKDRPGFVRAVSESAKVAGYAVLESMSDGSVFATVEPAKADAAERRERGALEMVRQRVVTSVAATDGLNRTQIKNTVTGGAADIAKAVNELVNEGYLAHVGDSVKLVVAKPYPFHPGAPVPAFEAS